MGKIIAVANQKGGVGKTTTAVNVSVGLAELGKRVLLVDCDPQGNATSGLGINKNELEHSTYDVLINNMSVGEAKMTSEYRLDVLPAHMALAGAEIELVNLMSRETRMSRALNDVRHFYDYIIIDCPPSLGLLTLNSLAAADSVMLPLQCEFYALEGLSQLMQTIELVQQQLNPNLVVEGVVLTMYDSRTRLSEQVADEVRAHFGDLVYQTAIPRTVRLSEAPSFGQPIFKYDIRSKGAEAYWELSQEVMNRG